MTTATEEALGNLHIVVAEHLTDRIESGEATAAEVAAAISFLKNNNITCAPGEDSALNDLSKMMEARRSKRAGKPIVAELDIPDVHSAMPEGMH